MASCKLCNRETKYTCVTCAQHICNVCSVNVTDETPGYDEELYSIGQCPGETCSKPEEKENEGEKKENDGEKENEGEEKDQDGDDVLVLLEPPAKKAKQQKSLKSYFKTKERKIAPPSKQSLKEHSKPGDMKASKNKEKSKPPEEMHNEEEKVNKRSVTVDTVRKVWIPVSLKDLDPHNWFSYDDDGKILTKMTCLVCTKYEKSIDSIQGFSREWISGCTNFRISSAHKHAGSKAHKNAMERYFTERNEVRAPSDADQTTLLSAFKGGDKRSNEQTKKKFEVSYFVAKEELPFSKYERILDLEEIHGVDIGASYRNDKACAEFVDYLGEDQARNRSNGGPQENFEWGPFPFSE